MHTQNVKTAAPESSERWGENPQKRLDAFKASAEAERAYWMHYEKASVKAPEEIDVYRFHDALGRMYPLNWASGDNGESETFMSAEMYCGNVTEIFTRIGIRYFRMRNYSNLNHAQIVECVKEVFYQNDNSKK